MQDESFEPLIKLTPFFILFFKQFQLFNYLKIKYKKEKKSTKSIPDSA
jgi:hypothetical protein